MLSPRPIEFTLIFSPLLLVFIALRNLQPFCRWFALPHLKHNPIFLRRSLSSTDTQMALFRLSTLSLACSFEGNSCLLPLKFEGFRVEVLAVLRVYVFIAWSLASMVKHADQKLL